jgi:hypothetical protein
LSEPSKATKKSETLKIIEKAPRELLSKSFDELADVFFPDTKGMIEYVAHPNEKWINDELEAKRKKNVSK